MNAIRPNIASCAVAVLVVRRFIAQYVSILVVGRASVVNIVRGGSWGGKRGERGGRELISSDAENDDMKRKGERRSCAKRRKTAQQESHLMNIAHRFERKDAPFFALNSD
jgi:hypothetical protein